MNKRNMVFLDFTGTLEFYVPPKKPIKVKPVKVVKTKTSKWDQFYENVEGGYPYYMGEDSYYEPYVYGPNKDSVKLLRKLLDKTGAKIVYTTTRRYGGWKSCASFLGLPLKYSLGGKYGVTPEIPYEFVPYKEPKSYSNGKGGVLPSKPVVDESDTYKTRQLEILAWFKEYKGPAIERFVILDDDPISHKKLVQHAIPSIYDNGFSKGEYSIALSILTKGPKFLA